MLLIGIAAPLPLMAIAVLLLNTPISSYNDELVGDARGSEKARRFGNVFSAEITPAISQQCSKSFRYPTSLMSSIAVLLTLHRSY
jgi:hypothetical protein